MSEKRKFPEIKELWMLWVPSTNDWAIAIDDPVTHDAYLCAKSKAAAKALQEHQREIYDVESIIVKIF